MTTADTDVLIVGAGPTGLTLACELARNGVAFQIIERMSGPQPGSRGKGIQPRTLEVFDDLGVVDAVMAQGRHAMPISSIDAEGKETRGGGPPAIPQPHVPYPASLLTPEWRVEEALRNRLKDLGGSVSFDSALSDFEQCGGGVSATVNDGRGTRRITARWLVGCDGGRSVVRTISGIDFLGETLEAVRMIVADVRVEGLDRETWRMWRSVEGFAALCPLPSTNDFQFQASIVPGQDPELSLANMQSILERRSKRRDITLQDPSWTSLWRANVRMVDRYRSGRMFLAGDAAHVHSPAGGQGMNTGIQDSYNLGWKLAAVINGAPPALLDTYQEERLPVAASVLSLSSELMRESVAQRGITIVGDERTLQLGLSYRASSLARDDGGANDRPHGGDRAPDAPGLVTAVGERRLFDLLRGVHFTLLCFGDTIQAPLRSTKLSVKTFRVVQKLKDANDLIDRDGWLAKAYGATDGMIVLIRPDGYIAFIAATAKTGFLMDYLHHVLGA